MPDEGPDRAELLDAARAGAMKAGFHMVRAGWEVLAGIGAFVEEMRKVMREDSDEGPPGPERIPVEED